MTTVRVPAYEEVLIALCRSVTTNEGIRVEGRQEGYRCKATYSLRPALVVSPLSMPHVNAVAAAVDQFCTAISRVPLIVDDFFCEVCVKVSRRGEYMVKLTLLNRWLDGSAASESAPAAATASAAVACSALSVPAADGGMRTLFDVWRRSAEPLALERHLRTKFPGLIAVVAHVRQPAVDATGDAASAPRPARPALHSKPDKFSAYVPLNADGAASMVEYTPNGRPFRLSADSFCEVNHDMEGAIFHAIVEFLRLDGDVAATNASQDVPRRSTGDATVAAKEMPATTETGSAAGLPAPCRRRAFICGRDVNSVVRTFEDFYRATTVATSCPCVFADANTNGIAQCQLRAKDQLAELLHGFANAAPSAARDVAPEEAHVLITAGRHGLHPHTTVALAQLAQLAAAARVTDLIYVSCNVESLTRDVHVLKEAMFIAHARTFDFFPGTDYVMTVLHLRPLCAVPRCGLLVLPVGVPGTGKSTSGRALAAFFATVHCGGACETTYGSSAKQLKGPAAKRARREGRGALSCVVPRSFLAVSHPPFDYRHVERDQVFHDAHASAGLKAAKQQTHEALLAALGSWADTRTPPCGTERSVTGSPQVSRSAVPQRGVDDNAVLLEQASVSRRVLYLDSTNGSREARQLYCATWGSGEDAAKGGCAPASCLALFFQPPSAATVEAELLARVQRRGPHPSFPATADEQLRKLRVIADAVKGGSGAPSHAMGSEHYDTDAASYRVAASAVPDAAQSTVAEVLVAVFAHLLFSQELASSFVQGAVESLLGATTTSPP